MTGGLLVLSNSQWPSLTDASWGGWSALVTLAQQPEGGGNPLSSLFPAMVAIMLLAYFMFVRPQQQKERQYQHMLESLKENDHVQTTGGIYGVVTGVHRDAERVTLRVDDATGAKIKVGMWAIAQVISDDKDKPGAGKADAPAKNKK